MFLKEEDIAPELSLLNALLVICIFEETLLQILDAVGSFEINTSINFKMSVDILETGE